MGVFICKQIKHLVEGPQQISHPDPVLINNEKWHKEDKQLGQKQQQSFGVQDNRGKKSCAKSVMCLGLEKSSF